MSAIEETRAVSVQERMRRLFAAGVDEVRADDWTIAEDGSLYTLPFGSDEVRIGSIKP